MASKPTTQARIRMIKGYIADLKGEIKMWEAKLEYLKNKAYEPEDSLEG